MLQYSRAKLAEVSMADLLEVKIDSLRVSLTNPQRVVILKEIDGDRFLPIWIGPYEAEAITIALQEIEVSRPQTHDLIKSIITAQEGKLLRVVVSGLVEDVYYANLMLQTNEKETAVDCRPSDAIALAVRTHVPIFVERDVMDRAGISPEKEIREDELASQPTEQHDEKPKDERLSIFEEYLKKMDIGDNAPFPGEKPDQPEDKEQDEDPKS